MELPEGGLGAGRRGSVLGEGGGGPIRSLLLPLPLPLRMSLLVSRERGHPFAPGERYNLLYRPLS